LKSNFWEAAKTCVDALF